VGATNDEKDWVVQSQKGDHEAFENLVMAYQRMVHSLCYRMTGSLADADDLTQETFIKVFQHLPEYRGQALLSSWIYRIAFNQCLNWRKASARQQQLHEEWGQTVGETTDETDPRAKMVQEGLLKLNAKQRAAVILTSYEGLTHAQAALALGCSETTVSWRLFAARGKLKRLLKRASHRP
jgi:RNA polymerase sigma-70 factor (ECF subfamily)